MTIIRRVSKQMAEENEELMIESMEFSSGKLSMGMTGDLAKHFYALLLQLFRDSGADNFLTITVEHKLQKFEITIRDCDGNKTPAEKINELEREIEELKKD